MAYIAPISPAVYEQGILGIWNGTSWHTVMQNPRDESSYVESPDIGSCSNQCEQLFKLVWVADIPNKHYASIQYPLGIKCMLNQQL